MFFYGFATCQNPCFHWQGPYFRGLVPFNHLQKNTIRNHQTNHSKIIKKSTQNQFKIHSQIISSFSSIFCMKNASPGSHFESKMASKTHPKTHSKFHRCLDRFWKAFWLPFGSIWLAKLLPKRIQAAPGAQGGSKSVPRSPQTPKNLPK